MITLEPTLRTGLSGRDTQLLPDDEFRCRVEAARALMGASDIDALVVLGSAADSGLLTYFSGMVPWVNWAALIVPRQGEPTLVSLVGPREKPVIQAQNWIADVRTPGGSPQVGGKAIAEALAATNSKTVGFAGLEDVLDGATARIIEKALADSALVPFDAPLQELCRLKSPRELIALRAAHALAQQAATSATAAFARSGDIAQAAWAAQWTAYRHGAHDIRLLTAGNQSYLAPPCHRATAKQRFLSLYCAVERSGYWGLAALGLGPDGVARTPEALTAMLDRIAGGASAASVARAGLQELSAGEREDALSYGLGSGIGTSLTETPRISPDSEDVICAGDLLSLRIIHRTHGTPVCSSKTVVVGAQGWQAL